jgi:putative tricarboxylic transport membrane protein
VNRVGERVVLACIFALCAAMAWIAWGYSLRDSIGPGAGFFPFWLGLLGCAMSLALMVKGWEGGQALLPDGRALGLIGMLVAGLVAAAVLLQPLGFRLTMLAFCVALLLALGVRRPLPIAIFSLACSVGLYHVFFHWLKVPLP